MKNFALYLVSSFAMQGVVNNLFISLHISITSITNAVALLLTTFLYLNDLDPYYDLA